MNWGKGILITIIVFLAGTAIMTVIAVNSEYDLVASNYYEQGIKYQEKIDKINRTNSLTERTIIEFSGNAVSVSLPRMFSSDKITGEVRFYRPSNAGSDFKMPLHLDPENRMLIGTDKLEKGFWKIQIEWSAEGIQYYNESFFKIN